MSSEQIDSDGFRPNVGIILANKKGGLLLAGRRGGKGWQFPQGGVQSRESAEEAMYRELYEEVGLLEEDVEILGTTEDWLRYRLPGKYIRRNSKPLCIGQKQRWFLLRLVATDDRVCLNRFEQPEFDRWRWVDFWRPVNDVIYFKRRVYARALYELGPHLHPQGLPPRPRWWPKRWQRAFEKDIEATKKTTTASG